MLAALILFGCSRQDAPKKPAETPAPSKVESPQAQPPQGQTPSGQQPTPPQQQETPWGQMLVPIAICIFIFYFMLIRPQKKQMKEREEMLNAIKKGAEVITSSGIVGKVVRVKDQEIILLVDSKREVQMTFLKSAVATVRKPSEESSEEEEKDSQEAKGSKDSESSSKG